MTVALVTFVDCGGNRPIDLLPVESEVLSFREINQANEENPLGYSGAGCLAGWMDQGHSVENHLIEPITWIAP